MFVPSWFTTLKPKRPSLTIRTNTREIVLVTVLCNLLKPALGMLLQVNSPCSYSTFGDRIDEAYSGTPHRRAYCVHSVRIRSVHYSVILWLQLVM